MYECIHRSCILAACFVDDGPNSLINFFKSKNREGVTHELKVYLELKHSMLYKKNCLQYSICDGFF
jgi:hypothetical protein